MIKRAVVLAIAIAALCGLIFFVDFDMMIGTLAGMSRLSLGLLIALFLVGALAKSLRWAFYLRAANLDIQWRDGATSYLAAMVTAPLPGGSWLAPRLAQEHGHVRMRQAAAALFMTFVGDAIAVSFIALMVFLVVGQPLYRYTVPLAGLTLAAVLIAMGRSPLVWNFVARLLAHWRLTQRWLPREHDIQARVSALMRPSVLLSGVGFSIATTLISTVFLIVLVDSLTFRGITMLEGLFVRSVSEATAIVIPVTGGFGVIDSSITGMLATLEIGLRRATFIALILRSVELVFKMAFGSVVLVLRYHEFLIDGLQLHRRGRRTYRRVSGVRGIRLVVRPIAGIVGARLAIVTGTTAEQHVSTDAGDG